MDDQAILLDDDSLEDKKLPPQSSHSKNQFGGGLSSNTLVELPPETDTDQDCYQSPPPSLEFGPFQTPQEHARYLSSIAPPKELCCPICMDLLVSPVVASDGNTYSRSAILRWFASKPGVAFASPVTGALMRDRNLRKNLAVGRMVDSWRESKGREILLRCLHTEMWRDEGERVRALVEVGANLQMKDTNGNTAVMLLLKAPTDPPKRLLKSIFEMCDDSVELGLTSKDPNGNDVASLVRKCDIPDGDFILREVERRGELERKKDETQRRRQQRENVRMRLEQQEISEEQRLANNGSNFSDHNMILDGRHIDLGTDNGSGLGNFTQAWGYFPSLFTLQFTGSVPQPPNSFREEEKAQKEKLGMILKVLAAICFVYLVIA